MGFGRFVVNAKSLCTRHMYCCQTRIAYRILRGRYQVNFRRRNNSWSQILTSFTQPQAIDLRKFAQFFKVAFQFHPGHLQPKTRTFVLWTIMFWIPLI